MAFDLQERKKLLAVMKQLFMTPDDLRTFLRDNTGRNLLDITALDNLTNVTSRVIDHADGWEWLPELVEALKEIAPPQARESLESLTLEGSFAKPRADRFLVSVRKSMPTAELLTILEQRLHMQVAAGNADAALANAQFLVLARIMRGEAVTKAALRKPLEDLGLLAPTPDNLQQLVNESNSLLEFGIWLSRLTEIEGQVCRIGIETGLGIRGLGTGFLVGPSTVLTNHHVVRDALNGAMDPKRLRVQFDYRVLRNGGVDAGTIVELDAANWLIDAKPHGLIDTQVHPIEDEPAKDELDYALLRLADDIGTKSIAGGTTPRGWMDTAAFGDEGAAGSAVFIVQHPAGTPMKLAIDTNGIIGYSPNSLRVRYRTNTLKGSSGSPVFNQDLELIALHHAGDPAYAELDVANYNEGIPMSALHQHFKDHNLLPRLAE